jgi:hypothetical protein
MQKMQMTGGPNTPRNAGDTKKLDGQALQGMQEKQLRRGTGTTRNAKVATDWRKRPSKACRRDRHS